MMRIYCQGEDAAMKTLRSCYYDGSTWQEKCLFQHPKLSVCAGGRVEKEGRKEGRQERRKGEREEGGERENQYINSPD